MIGTIADEPDCAIDVSNDSSTKAGRDIIVFDYSDSRGGAGPFSTGHDWMTFAAIATRPSRSLSLVRHRVRSCDHRTPQCVGGAVQNRRCTAREPTHRHRTGLATRSYSSLIGGSPPATTRGIESPLTKSSTDRRSRLDDLAAAHFARCR
jgi:hypothetical protein